MTEQSYDAPSADKVLEFLEDYTLTTYQSRCSNYKTIQSILEKEIAFDNESIKRLLAVCVHDLNEDMKYAVNTLNVITVILKKVKAGECQCLPELTTSALAILNIIKTTALISKVQTLQLLCFDTFLSFPDDTHCEIGTNHSSEVMEVFNLYFHQGIPMTIRLKPFNILFKMLKMLPPDKRLSFVKEGLAIWFAKVIPTTMAVVVTNNSMVPKIVQVLELLTEDLAVIDYSNHNQWQPVWENCCNPQKYPTVMKTMLENGSDYWHRVWIVFVKLLKHQIAVVRKQHGSAVNSMLPVVEKAFKMNVTHCCRAFDCWNVLIDNSSTETNESDIVKRIKLLKIPLKSINANVEQIALEKFNTWWHFIRKFRYRLDKYLDTVFVPFLHFCFGKHGVANILVPGLRFPTTTKKCVQAFVEITGHTGCEGCVPKKLPGLGDRILEPEVLLDFLTDWIYSLKVFTKLLSSRSCVYEKKDRYLRCVWGSFLGTISEMSQDNLLEAYGEILALMTQMTQESQDSEGTLETVFNILTKYMTERQQVWSTLMTGLEDSNSHLYNTLTLLMSPSLQRFYSGTDPKGSLKLRPLTDLLLNESKSHNELMEWILLDICPNENTIWLWAALMESVVATKSDISEMNVKNMLLWPLKHFDSVGNCQHAALIWNSSYDKLQPKINNSSIAKDILLLLNGHMEKSNLFTLYGLLQIIKDSLTSAKSAEWKMEAEMLADFLSKTNTYKDVEPAFPVIIDSLVMMIKRVGDEKNASLANCTLTAANSALRILLESAKNSGTNDEHAKNVEKLLTPLNEQFKTDLGIKFKFLLHEQLIACAAVFDKYQSIKGTVCSILKTFLMKSKATEVPFYSVVNQAIVSIEKGDNSAKEKFTMPKVLKKIKKKEPNIVKTVVENGEEYVVVKSNWKFNPRKLTENQKEKLQRKREDIPALYQDLSQSQDEIKLQTWKTDSQDTSPSNSVSRSNSKTGDATTVLKNMPSSEVVPQIMENIFSDKEVVDKVTNENTIVKTNKPTELTPKQVKEPRVLLENFRVFRNLNISDEKSNPKEGETVKELNRPVSDDSPKTSEPKTVSEVTAAYSAPPKIVTERPARVKRKPQKLLDFAELNKKKRSNSTYSDNVEMNSYIDSAEFTKKKRRNSTYSDNVEMNSLESNDDSNVSVTDSNVAITIEDSEPEKPIEIKNNLKLKTEKVKSRIMKQLAIDMIEGHPILNVDEKRSTEQTKLTPVRSRRKSLVDKLNSSQPKTEAKTRKKPKLGEEKTENKEILVKELSATVRETPEGFSTTSSSLDDMPMSEDFIESSQDSTLTTITVKSTKSITKKSPKVKDKLNGDGLLKNKMVTESQNLVSDDIVTDQTINDANDIEFSRNKIAADATNSTADFDTEPVDENKPLNSSDDRSIIIINDEPTPKVLNTENTLEIANADTETIDADMTQKILNKPESIEIHTEEVRDYSIENKTSETAEDTTVTLQSTGGSEHPNDTNGLSSPYKDDGQRNQDFLNNTLEISPIKTMSPVPDKLNSPETMEFVIIELSSPVQSNGEPFDKIGSPEIFTADKLSPDKRDQSPSREETGNNNNSPSSALSLKKNRPQVRSGGRAAQMIGLCALDNGTMNAERSTYVEESKKTPARRNLRVLYNIENTDVENTECFLKFKRALPTAECSPSGPILKRKLADIADAATVSPASKRKRVSFHDPPVSTTISVQKYIDPLGERSPQAPPKLAPRQAKMKSPKKLENIFKLDTALTKTMECFVDLSDNPEDTTSLEPTLSVELVKNDQLDDSDPICLALVNCKDPIENIAADLSSPTMKELLVKELQGNIETVGDLAKLTELQVNRLCIKAPKVKVAKRALADYEEKMLAQSQDFGPIEQIVEAQINESLPGELKNDIGNKDMQTDSVSLSNKETQTSQLETDSCYTQTEVSTAASSVQTDDIDPWEIVKTYISENPKEIGLKLSHELKDASIQQIVETLPHSTFITIIVDVIRKAKFNDDFSKTLLSNIFKLTEKQIVKELVSETFTDKEKLMFCMDLMRSFHDKLP